MVLLSRPTLIAGEEIGKSSCACTTRFYTWRCSRSTLDHLFLNIVSPLSFTSLPLDLLSRWVLKLYIWECTDQIPDATTLPFVTNVKEDQDVVLRELGNPGDGSHRKGMKRRSNPSLNGGEAAHLEAWRRAQAGLNAD